MARRPGTGATKGASMADVARLARVSGQTVSRVANGNARVSPETREKVEEAMRQLGYRANAAARALATGKFRTIGVVTFNLTAVGNIRIVDSVIAGAQEQGYSISLAVVETPTEQGVRAAVRGLTDRAVDGIIVIEARVLDTPNLQLPEEVPVVIADGGATQKHPSFGMDEAAGARAAVDHLLELGHATVHHLSGPSGSHPGTRRRTAWRQALRRAGRVVPRPALGDWSPESGYKSGLELIAQRDVTAVFAANDQMAAGILRAAQELGLRLPEQLSVVGYDNIDIAPYLSPPLTTVNQDLEQVGRRCLDHLLLLMEDPQASTDPRGRLVRPRLVVRSSTAPPER
ncbi:LacI family DNA-binding transcriptional regulator [Ruania halotolerans]|uniref:LacI family DNA-binding transcriptional regulator n=1 Tax=Ruania halotolerans TaxID=2897773 RepID=UPI001E367417|nr:substrate-binding domain-containing protein [Ruania halotolerans]UFU06491.1 substrate-binding domain-containing protein [Ruania halotolerans]